MGRRRCSWTRPRPWRAARGADHVFCTPPAATCPGPRSRWRSPDPARADIHTKQLANNIQQ
eukprot:6838111-Pyramimonas_sp.AAC.1